MWVLWRMPQISWTAKKSKVLREADTTRSLMNRIHKRANTMQLFLAMKGKGETETSCDN